MSKDEWKKWLGVVGRMLLAYALVFTQGAWAAQNQATKDKPDSPQKAAAQQANQKQPSTPATAAKAQTTQAQGEESESAVAEEKPSNDASHQGIKVHGHWTIEVRNPDGGVVTHTEFENSLSGAGLGASTISNILTRKNSAGGWSILLLGNNGPCQASGIPVSCIINEPNLAGPAASFIFNTLSVNVDQNSNIVVSGEVPAALNDSINSVGTSIALCPVTIAPAAPCPSAGLGGGPLTSATASSTNPGFSSPVPVSAGQTIAVTVRISFS